MDTSSWEKEMVGLEALAQSLEVARRTRGLLDNQGWCLWKCSAFDDDIIVVCRDEFSGHYQKGYPVYMECELEMIAQGEVTSNSLSLVHEAKKLAGAKLVNE